MTFTITDKLTGTRSVKVRVTRIGAPGGDGEQVVNTYAATVPKQVILEWTGVAAQAYQPMVGIVTYGSGTAGAAGYLDVLSILYEFVPSAASGEVFRSDPSERYVADRLDSSLNLLSLIGATGELPFQADRGANFLSFRQDEVPLQYYLDRQNVTVRVPTVAFAYRPGFYEL